MLSWGVERRQLKSKLYEATRQQRSLQADIGKRKSVSSHELRQLDEIAHQRKGLVQSIVLIDQKRSRLGLDSHGDQSVKDLAPELIVRETVSGLEIFLSLLRSQAVLSEHKFLEAEAHEWLALEIQRLSEQYINVSYPTVIEGKDGRDKPGPALRFAEIACRLVMAPNEMPWKTIQYHWLRRRLKRKRGEETRPQNK